MNYFKIILAVFSFTLFSCQGQESAKVEQLDAKTFSEKVTRNGEVQLLDVRTPEEFSDQHIFNAKNINWFDSDFADRVAVLDKSKPVYVYCKSGGRSAKASAKLSEMGFTKIYELDGGMMKWNAAGLSKPSTETIGMTQDDFNKLLISDKKVLIDFYAEWCAPCKKMGPYLDKMTTEMADKVTIIRIDADKNKTLVEQMKIDGLPTLLLYENKELKWKNQGFISEQDLIKKL
ncbi:thioredoxin domain-containing protein [Flavobacterium antarcticum]|uniref:thioredoxin domain-containing protein n=1 Tax=Flavobacterium antarcticum TaxID=271155 RepID=UPI0003B6FC7F|nr:thioredoxin domain-containing protein [Flavobacterium antarcticum]